MASDNHRRNIVIIGGGIIGCTSAYFITRHPAFDPALHSVTILEATAIAAGASGKAGGLLALWAYPSSIVPLSYRLHAELAAEHNGEERWGYRKIHCGSLTAKGRLPANDKNGESKMSQDSWTKLPKRDENALAQLRAAGVPKDLDWFDPSTLTGYSAMGDPSTTAQVHPYQFTTSIASLACDKGVQITLGAVTALDYADNKVRSVTYEDKATKETHTIPATDVVLAAGPWTSRVFPGAHIEAVRAHSVTIKADVSPYAIFTEIELPAGLEGGDTKRRRGRGKTVAPEIYARPNCEVYACGEADSLAPLPPTADLVQVSPSHIHSILVSVNSISDVLASGETLVKQACYLPSVASGSDGPDGGGPMIGPTRVKGLYIAAGHTCWGIQNSCATGKIISEFLWDGKAVSADVGELDPGRWGV